MLESVDMPDGYFEYLFPKNEFDDFHSAIQRVFAEEIVAGKITVTLVKTKMVQIPVFCGVTEPQIRDKVRCGQSSK